MKKNNCLLWRIESAGRAPSWLFGTMHIKDAKAFRLLDTLYDCINQSKSFATELHLDEMKSGGVGSFNLAPVPPLYHLLPIKRYQKLKQILKKALNIDLDRWAHAHPMLINNLISEAILSSEMPVFLDDQLWQYARSKGKNMFGIETLEEQLTIMQDLPFQDHVDHLQQISKNYSRFRRNLLRLLDHYEKGDLRSLHKSALKGAGKQKETMVFKRNKIMADRIDQLIQKEESIFCAVGAGHLSGEKGVLRFLKQNGYKLYAHA